MSYKPVPLHEVASVPSLSPQPSSIQSSAPSHEVPLNVILPHFLSFLLFLHSLSHLMETTDSFDLLRTILAHDHSTIWSFCFFNKAYQQPFIASKIEC